MDLGAPDQVPSWPEVETRVRAVHAETLGESAGSPSAAYPALQDADARAFGISLRTREGIVAECGDCDIEFPVMSVSKPFVYALVCADLGVDRAGDVIGVEATGRAFDALEPVTDSADGRTNPMVTPGAIATASHVARVGSQSRWQRVHSALSAFAGRDLDLDEETYAAAGEHPRNRALVAALDERGLLGCSAAEALDVYNRQCCLRVTASDLGVMGATLSAGGRNPLTGEQVVPPQVCEPVVAAMVTAGLYESSGAWFRATGLPAKSGIGGGIVTVTPGIASLGLYSPPLDAAGTSVRGRAAASVLGRDLGLSLLAPNPSIWRTHGSADG